MFYTIFVYFKKHEEGNIVAGSDVVRPHGSYRGRDFVMRKIKADNEAGAKEAAKNMFHYYGTFAPADYYELQKQV